MEPDAEELQRALAVRSDDELAGIVANSAGVYTVAAVDAAQRELAARARANSHPSHTAARLPWPATRRRYLRPSELIPLPIRASLWLAVVYGIASTVQVVNSAITQAIGGGSHEILSEYVGYGAAAITSWWIVIAIKRGYAYTRTLLIVAFAAWLAVGLIVNVIAKRSINALSDLALPAFMLWYIVRNGDVAAYYRHLRSTRHSAISAAG